ncbi:MAG: hypothetical protein AAGH57_15710 [Pseudomonadota bacterium]
MSARPTSSTLFPAIGFAAMVVTVVALAGFGPALPARAQPDGEAPACGASKRLGPGSTLDVSVHKGANDIPDIKFKWRVEGTAQNAHSLKNVAFVGEPDWIAAHTVEGRYPLGGQINKGSFDRSTVTTNFKTVVGAGDARAKTPVFDAVTAQYSFPDPKYDGSLPSFLSDMGYGAIQAEPQDAPIAELGKTTRSPRMSLERERSYIGGVMFRGEKAAHLPHRIKLWWTGATTFMVLEMEVGAPQDIKRDIVSLEAEAQAMMQRGQCSLKAPLPPRKEAFDDPVAPVYPI